MVSINQSASSYGVRGHVSKASSNAAASVARLSSGHRITQSSEDVAGLAVGTTIQTGITSLRQAMRNAAQGTSLLQVADGALAQISDILQRQKTIATQANSGVLSNKERIYLNNEFQALTAQIDQIVGNTTFSGTRLLDGSLALSSDRIVGSTFEVDADPALSTVVPSKSPLMVLSQNPSDGDKVTINGVEFEFTTAAAGTAAAAGKVQIVPGNRQETSRNFANVYNQSTDLRLSNIGWMFPSNGGPFAGRVSVYWTGGTILASDNYLSPNITVSEAVAGTFSLSARSAFTATSIPSLGAGRTKPLGESAGILLRNGGNSAATSAYPIATSSVYNNKDFLGQVGAGSIGVFSATYNSLNMLTLSLQVGEITYRSSSFNVTSVSSVTLTGYDATGALDGGSFTLHLKGGAVAAGALNSQSAANDYADDLTEDMAGITFVQNRDVLGYSPAYTPKADNKDLAEMSGIKFQWQTDDFSGGLEAFDIIPPSVTGGGVIFKAIINGETYLSRSDIGSQFGASTIIGMQSTSDPNHSFIMTTSSSNAFGQSYSMDVSNDSKAAAVAAAIRASFGTSEFREQYGLDIQIGKSSTELLQISLEDTSSEVLFNETFLEVDTISNAQMALTMLDRAIATVTAQRASVGALQSRLDFTSGNLLTAIENQDAARGGILDTDFAGESTRYADAQVQLKMGVSLLAQVNKIPKDLIGLLE